jgi:hypothetical protein
LKDQRLKLGAEIVFGYWMEVFNHPRATLATDDARERTLVRHLKDNGEDISELLYVIDGARKDTPRNKDTGEVYDGIPTLFRDRAQIERFANRMPGYKAEKPHPVAVQYADLFRELTEPAVATGARPRFATRGKCAGGCISARGSGSTRRSTGALRALWTTNATATRAARHVTS